MTRIFTVVALATGLMLGGCAANLERPLGPGRASAVSDTQSLDRSTGTNTTTVSPLNTNDLSSSKAPSREVGPDLPGRLP